MKMNKVDELNAELTDTFRKKNKEERGTQKWMSLDAKCESIRRKIDILVHGEVQVIPEVLKKDEVMIVEGGSGFLETACTLEQAVNSFNMFEKAKQEILAKGDKMDLKGKPYIKRSGWMKLAAFFQLCWKFEKAVKIEQGGGHYMYEVKATIYHPSGKTIESIGYATSHDSFIQGQKEKREHHVIMKAQTVALNRGVSNMLGSGEVSADEVE